MRRRAVVPALAALGVAAGSLLAAHPAAAAVGDFSITYDWTKPQTGFAGVRTFETPDPNLPGFLTPFYRFTPAAGAGLQFATAVAADGTTDRMFPLPTPTATGGPSVIADIPAPPTTQIRSAEFSQIAYRRGSGDKQLLRLGIFGAGAEAVFDTRDDAPRPGPFDNDVDYTPADFGVIRLRHPSGSGDQVQAWFFTGCGDTPPLACPTVTFNGTQPRSHAQVGRIQIDLHDDVAPEVSLSGGLADGAWTNTRQPRSVQITATDQGAGVSTLQVQRRTPDGTWRDASRTLASCDRNHTGPGEPGRGGATCPSTFQQTFTQSMTALPDGVHPFRVIATDDSGRKTMQGFTVRVDRHGPTTTLAGPLVNLSEGWSSIRSAVAATIGGTDDRSGIAAVDLFARQDGHDTLVTSIPVCSDDTCAKAASQQAMVDLGAFPEGQIAITARARDRAGNVGHASHAKKLRLDRRAPNDVRAVHAVGRGSELDVSFAHGGKDLTFGHAQTSGLKGFRITLTDSTFTEVRARSPDLSPQKRRAHLKISAAKLKGAFVLVQAVDKAGNASMSVPARVGFRRPLRTRRKLVPLKRASQPKSKPVEFGFTDDPWDPGPRDPVLDSFISAVRAIRQPAHRFVAVRGLFPYDMWQTDPSGTQSWHDFATRVRNLQGSGVHVKAMVVLRSHRFDKCPDPDAPADTTPVLPTPVSYPAPGTTPVDPPTGPYCPYPKTAADYGKYFKDWLDHTGNGATRVPDTDQNFLPVATWGVWNEPDHPLFTLHGIPNDPGAGPNPPPAGAILAAQYWIAAKQQCPMCRIVAGEFSDFNATWIESYKNYLLGHTGGAGEPAAPDIWTIHAYNSLLPLGSRRDTIRDYISKLEEHVARPDFRVWVTETGALLRIKPDTIIPIPSAPDPRDRNKEGEPQFRVFPHDTPLNNRGDLQFKAGQELLQLERISRRLDLVFYYGAIAPTSQAFDDELADSDGQLRPVVCGTHETKLNTRECPGNPAAATQINSDAPPIPPKQ